MKETCAVPMIPCQRHLFDIPDEIIYLNCAYISPLLKSVRQSGFAGVGRKSQPWQITPEDFFISSERARKLFARIIGATCDDIALVPSASYGLAIAMANTEVKSDQNIVIIEDQFPSNVYPWRELARRESAQIHTVKRPADDNWTKAIEAAINEQTRIVALPNCHWTDGGLIDLIEIGAHCRAVGASLVLDVTQSLGALPFDVAAVRPDYLSCAAYKWLLGPYSMGFCYVAPHLQEGQPLEYSWMQRAGSENFSDLVAYRDEYQTGARRYDVGEHSNFALMPMVISALEQLLEWNIQTIYDTLSARNSYIAERASSLGLSSISDQHRAGHFLGLRCENGIPSGLLQRLASRNVYVSARGNSIRVTPHLWNSDSDIDRFFEALEAEF